MTVENALEAALARPLNRTAYGTPNLFELAAAVAAGEIDEEGATRFLRDVSAPYPG